MPFVALMLLDYGCFNWPMTVITGYGNAKRCLNEYPVFVDIV